MSESQPPSAPTPEPGKPQEKPAAGTQGAGAKADANNAGDSGDKDTKNEKSKSDDPGRMNSTQLKWLTAFAALFLFGLILLVGDLTWSVLPNAVRADESQNCSRTKVTCNQATQPSSATSSSSTLPSSAVPTGLQQKNPPPSTDSGADQTHHDQGTKSQEANSPTWGWGDIAAVLIGLAAALVGAVGGVMIALEMPTPDSSSIRFQRHLVGLGFSLLTDGMINIVAIAGYAKGGVLAQIFSKDVLCRHLPCAMLILTCLGMAIEGALFFFCNSLYEKLNSVPDDNEFDVDQFWGGLWFRLGEAVIFTNVLILYVLTWVNPKNNADGSTNVTAGAISIYTLPLISLLCGMFLKPAEVLVYGIMERAFAGFEAMTGTKSDGQNQSGLLTTMFDAAPLPPADGTPPPKTIDEKNADALHRQLLKAAGVQVAVWSKRGEDLNGTLKVVTTAKGPSAQDIIGWAKAQNITLTVAKG